MDQNDFINKINQDKSQNNQMFGKDFLNNVHEKVMNRLKGGNTNSQAQNNPNAQNAEAVINADKQMREAVKNFAYALMNLNDKEVAKSLISEHIFILNDLFKSFE